MKKEHCLNCNHSWVPRIERPMACPKCKNYLDRQNKRRAEGEGYTNSPKALHSKQEDKI